MTRGSGVTPAKARSKVARVTPFACASGHSSLRNAAKGMSGLAGWASVGGPFGAGCAFCAGGCQNCAAAGVKVASAAHRVRIKSRGVMVSICRADDDDFGSGGLTSQQRHQRAAMALQPAGKLELEEHDTYGCGRGT